MAATVRGRWKRSRLLAGGLIVLLAAVWTGPKMAAAAPKNRDKDKHGQATTTTAAPTTTTTTAPPTTTTTAKPRGKPTTTTTAPPTTTTTAKPRGKPTTTTTTTAAKPKGGGPDGGESSGGGGGPGPGTDGGTGGAPSAEVPGSGPPASGPGAPAAGTAGAGASDGSVPWGRGAGDVTRRIGGARSSGPTRSLGSLNGVRAVPGAPAVAALQGPDGAAQATVRGVQSGQGAPSAGGANLYAQLAAAPLPSSNDDIPANPYVVFVILSIFGVGVALTGRGGTLQMATVRRRHPMLAG